MEDHLIAAYRRELRGLIGCPIRWEDHFGDARLCKELRIYWTEIATKFQVDGEISYYLLKNVVDMDDSDLRAVRVNTDIWRSRAVEHYTSDVGFLTRISHLDAYAYPKHFPNPKLGKDRIRTESARGVSLFYPAVSQEALGWLFESVLSQAWLTIVSKRPPHVFLTDEGVVGASEGEETRTIRFDIDYATPTVHSHPRLAKDIAAGAVHCLAEDFDPGCYDENDENYSDLFSGDIDEPDDHLPETTYERLRFYL